MENLNQLILRAETEKIQETKAKSWKGENPRK
jgi:hypothetical protein